MEIEESVIRRGRRPRRIKPSEISIILHMIRKPNSIIVLLFSQNNSLFNNIAKPCFPPSMLSSSSILESFFVFLQVFKEPFYITDLLQRAKAVLSKNNLLLMVFLPLDFALPIEGTV